MSKRLSPTINIYPEILTEPLRTQPPYSWVGHIPFAFWIVGALRPQTIVELGTHTGNSFCALCQAVEMHGTETKCYAVDTWRGDEHAGEYSEQIYQDLAAYHNPKYGTFSSLIRSTFDDALPRFVDGSIDLLHIDGCHTYEAVKHDFETWLPKISSNGICLLHDTNVFRDNFGVWQLWDELKDRYPTFAFRHAFGLGVLGIGSAFPPHVQELFEAIRTASGQEFVQNLFSTLGGNCTHRSERDSLKLELQAASARHTQLEQQRDHVRIELQSAEESYRALERQRDEAQRVFRNEFEEASRRHLMLEHAVAELTSAFQAKTEENEVYSQEITRLQRLLSEREDELRSNFPPPRAADSDILRLQEKLSAKRKRVAVSVAEVQLLLRQIKNKGDSFARAVPRIMLSASRLKRSGLFDRAYYLRQYPDLTEVEELEVLHYIISGFKEGRNPHALFETQCYLSSNPDLEEYFAHEFDARFTDPLSHYLNQGFKEKRNPHPLFDTAYYQRSNPDVTGNPLVHFLNVGWKEGRKPHPLFDINFYLQHNPDIAAAGVNPLQHFVECGFREGRDPNQFFSLSYYRRNNPDIDCAEVNPLVHFAAHGGNEGRNPSPKFDSQFYLEKNPDVAKAGVNPLAHYLETGQAEGRPPLPKEQLPSFKLRLLRSDFALGVSANERRAVHVIVPVYRSLHDTRRCIESLLASLSCNSSSVKVTVIEDKSPEPELVEYLRSLESGGVPLRIVHNQKNLGFVGSVNLGMNLHPEADVLLLNSDTEVFGDWIDRMQQFAYSDEKIATVTASSNNATICSIPSIEEAGALPAGLAPELLDRAFSQANQGRAVTLPVGVGFCMFINRTCLDEIGLFDQETFGKGYGEEVDFCMKAAGKGWLHLQACDTFVYHKGEVSFGENTSPSKATATEIILKRYPDYNRRVQMFVANDEARSMRIAALLQYFRLSGLPTVLVVTHSLGGGTETYVRNLCARLSEAVNFILLKPLPRKRETLVSLSLPGVSNSLTFAFDPQEDFDLLLEVLRQAGVSKIHIQHRIGMPLQLQKLVDGLGVPFDFTAHDYYSVCPRISMIGQHGSYCGEPCAIECNNCLADDTISVEIEDWRLQNQWLLLEANRVICPSQDVAERLRKYAPTANYVVAPHEEFNEEERKRVIPKRLEDGKKLRIAILGILARHKGLETVRELVALAERGNLPFELVLVGYTAPEGEIPHSASFKELGEYREEELTDIFTREKIDLVWFPGAIPETYSYTLSSAFRAGLPVLAPKIGAFVERLQGREWSWLVPCDLTAADFARFFAQIRSQNFLELKAPEVPAEEIELNYVSAYGSDYASGRPWREVTSLKNAERVSVVAIVETNSDWTLSPCAYIRVLLPLLQMKDAGEISFYAVRSVEEARRYDADIYLTHRVALKEREQAETLISLARNRGAKLVYDLDDDLLNLAGQPEENFYNFLSTIVRTMLSNADCVWVSTDVLLSRLEKIGIQSEVMPNYLDPRIWNLQAPRSRSSSVIRVLYMGTLSHLRDVELIRSPLRRIKEDFGDQVTFDIIGAIDRQPANDRWYNLIRPPLRGISYPHFAGWLSSLDPYDIGIAPLEGTRFNRAKSAIKFYEYTAIGACTVASNLEPYRGFIDDNVSGKLVKNDHEDWYRTIKALILDPPFRRALALNAVQAVKRTSERAVAEKPRMASLYRLLER